MHEIETTDDDPLRPSASEYKATYEKAYRTWSTLYKHARLDSTTTIDHLPIRALALQPIPNHFPHHPSFPVGLDVNDDGWLVATSTWTPSDDYCDLPPFEEKLELKMFINKPTKVRVSKGAAAAKNAGLPKWFEYDGPKGCHLAVLALAWAYVFAARWAEIVDRATPPEYTDSQAGWVSVTDESDKCSESDSSEGKRQSNVVELGALDDEAARWWAAILAPGQGWMTTIPHKERKNLPSPWSVSVTWKDPILLSSASKRSTVPTKYTSPPSPEAAVRYIEEYASLYSCLGQARAAFSIALVLPMANRYHTKVPLPTPGMPRDRRDNAHLNGAHPTPPVFGTDLAPLDRFLTMSCNPEGLLCLLSSVIYDRDTPSTLCSAWHQGTFAVLRAPYARDPHILAGIFFRRSPHLSLLWLGGILIGMQGILLEYNECTIYRVEPCNLHAAAWTGTLITFAQEPAACPAVNAQGEISRVDECKLIFLSGNREKYDEWRHRPPSTPWAGPGTTNLRDTIIAVQIHAQCPTIHRLRCTEITWPCTNGRLETRECEDVELRYPFPTQLDMSINVDFGKMHLYINPRISTQSFFFFVYAGLKMGGRLRRGGFGPMRGFQVMSMIPIPTRVLMGMASL